MIIFLGDDSGYEEMIKKSAKDSTDIIVSCQYRHKVPESLLKSHICVNIHYGILPFYAGCNPVYWQVANDSIFGVTLHYMDMGFDSGDIIDIWQAPIGNLDAGECYQILKKMGFMLFEKYYERILEGDAPRRAQDLEFHTYYKRSDIDFQREKFCSIDDTRKIRAMHFGGKQYPVVEIENKFYELRRYECE